MFAFLQFVIWAKPSGLCHWNQGILSNWWSFFCSLSVCPLPLCMPTLSQGHWQDQSTWLNSMSLTLISIWNFRSTNTLIPGHLQQIGHGHNKLNMNTHLLCLLICSFPFIFHLSEWNYQLLKKTFESSYNPHIWMIAKMQRFHLLKVWGFQLHVVYKKLTIKTEIDWR